MAEFVVQRLHGLAGDGMDAPLESALAMERRANALLFASHDQKEGMQAFLEKRPPKFEGR